MKKLLGIVALTIFAFSFNSAQAQDNSMKVSANVGFSTGNWGDAYGIGVNADFQYLFEVGEGFRVGPMAGLMWYSGKSIDVDYGIGSTSYKIDDAMFLPVGATARYNFDQFFIGMDLGYGIGLAPSGNNGGLYFRPKLGYDFGGIAGVVSYSGVSLDGGTASSVNVGVEFSF